MKKGLVPAVMRTLLMLLVLHTGSGWAQTKAIASFLPHAQLQGKANFTWFGLSIYAINLWSEAGALTTENLHNTPFALELIYARKLKGKKIAQASIDEMQKIGIGSAAQHNAWLASMQALFPDVEQGTHLTGLYQPGQATRFFIGDQLLGEIADPAFGPAFFAIWLHPKTSAPSLRRALLGLP